MDQQTTPNLTNEHYMTREFLQNQIAALAESIEKKDAMIISLQDRASQNSQREYATAAEMNRLRDQMQEWTLDELSNGQITESQAEEIASIMGFDLTKEVEVEVTVTYNFTVQVPYDEDAEDIINEIDFDAVTYDTDKITWVSHSVDRIDI